MPQWLPGLHADIPYLFPRHISVPTSHYPFRSNFERMTHQPLSIFNHGSDWSGKTGKKDIVVETRIQLDLEALNFTWQILKPPFPPSLSLFSLMFFQIFRNMKVRIIVIVHPNKKCSCQHPISQLFSLLLSPISSSPHFLPKFQKHRKLVTLL